jgi:hypothetical protein
MSRTDWEEGYVKIPGNQWAGFRAAIIGVYNAELQRKFALAQTAYEAAQNAGKGKRGFDRSSFLRNDPRFWSVAYYITRSGEKKLYKPIAMFRALDRIKWTARTGGEFVGNDEYNQDNRYAGGGGNYVTSSYGPKAEKRRGW